ncbi:MAG: 16S rRNA (guanine(527)-N(7))-methyltransferase RsmG [Sulfitobacter sp.]
MIDLLEGNVSRETYEKLQQFVQLVEKWNPKINLVSKASISDIWERHILDSIQLFNIAPKTGKWVDLGSGGGFPGIVVAIMAYGDQTKHHVTLVESDQRKSVFLRTAIRELGLNAKVISDRVESIAPLEADIISARALSDLSLLLEYSHLHLLPSGVALFPKGERWEKEHSGAQQLWSYTCEPIKSTTNPSAAVLKIKDIARV